MFLILSFVLLFFQNLHGSENSSPSSFLNSFTGIDVPKLNVHGSENSSPRSLSNSFTGIGVPKFNVHGSENSWPSSLSDNFPDIDVPKAVSLPKVHGSKAVDREKILREVREEVQRYIPEIVTPRDVEDKVHAYEAEHLINKEQFGGKEFFNTVLQEMRNVLVNAKMQEWIAKAYHRPLPLLPVSVDTNPSPLHTTKYGDFLIPITEADIPRLMQEFGQEQGIPVRMQNGFLQIEPIYQPLLWNYQSRLERQVEANDAALLRTIPDDIQKRIDEFCDDELTKLGRWINWSNLKSINFQNLYNFLQGIEDETRTNMGQSMRFERLYQYAMPRFMKKIQNAGITILPK